MKVHELLDSSEKWAKGYYAYDSEGKEVGEFHAHACQWCLAGAVYRCYYDRDHPWMENSDIQQVYQKIQQRIGQVIHLWNDAPERTYEEVYSLVKELDI